MCVAVHLQHKDIEVVNTAVAEGHIVDTALADVDKSGAHFDLMDWTVDIHSSSESVVVMEKWDIYMLHWIQVFVHLVRPAWVWQDLEVLAKLTNRL